MFFYYSIWFFISVATIFFKKSSENRFFYFIVLIFLFLMTGMRYEIGGDWNNYLIIYEYFENLGFTDALKVTDPGYGILNYISHYLGIKELILVNIFCSFCFYLCFYYFSKKIYNYWIPLLVSFPYLILVVSMGYTRQSVAISFVLIAILFGLEKNIKKYLIFLFLAILFHKTAIIGLVFSPFFIATNFIKKDLIFYSYTLFSFIFVSLVVYFSSVSGDNIYTNKSGELSSAGAIFRIAIHFLPLIFYIYFRSVLKRVLLNNLRVFDYLAYFILFTLILAIPFSTLADRFNLYLIMFDIFIFSYLYSNLSLFNRQFMILTIILFNTLMLIIWLNFGAWSHAWLPYQNYIFNYLMDVI